MDAPPSMPVTGLALPDPRAWPALALLAAAGIAASLTVGEGMAGLLGAGLALLALAIAVVDARHFIIPDALNAAAAALGLAGAALAGTDPAADVAAALGRGIALAALFLALRIGYRRLRGRDGLGLGDVKLAGVAGIWLDGLMLPAAIEIAALSALLACAVAGLRAGRAMSPSGRLPFGLFFAPAIWLAWLGGRWLELAP